MDINGWINNFALSDLNGRFISAASFKEGIIGGMKLDKYTGTTGTIGFYSMTPETTKVMLPVLSGKCLTGFIYCISQAKDNGGETFCSLR